MQPSYGLLPTREESAIFIQFKRTGGFAGLCVATDLDPDSLPAARAGAIRQMIREAGFFDLPAVFPALSQGADRFQYNLTIEDNGKRHSVEIHDTEDLPGSLKQLLKVLTDIARSRPEP